MVTIIWTDRATQYLNLILEYINIQSPDTAKEFYFNIQQSVNQLINFPNLGRIVPELNNKAIRELLVKKYRIIYEIQGEIIKILLVLHSKQRFHL